MIKQRIALVSAILCMAGIVQAATIEGVSYDEQIILDSQTLQLNGAGLRKKLFFKVYCAGLYVDQKSQDAQVVLSSAAPQRVRLVLMRDVSASSFVDALKEGLLDNTEAETLKAIQTEVDELINVMNKIGDVKKGDVVNFDWVQSGVSVVHNDKVIAQGLGSESLYRAVLRIWIGPKAIDAQLKQALLSNH